MNIETQAHLSTLRNLLNYRIHELNTELHAVSSSGADMTAEEVKDRKDEAANLQRQQIERESERIEQAELRRCEAALQRLDQGVYGDCADCEEPIPLARLFAQPDAERCAACQTAAERRGTAR